MKPSVDGDANPLDDDANLQDNDAHSQGGDAKPTNNDANSDGDDVAKEAKKGENVEESHQTENEVTSEHQLVDEKET